MGAILQYGNESEENAEDVLTWIDGTIREGIKDVYLQYYELLPESALLFTAVEKANQFLKSSIEDSISNHICSNTYGRPLILISAVASNSDLGRKIEFTYCTKLHMHDKKNMSTRAIDFPIIAEYYIEKGWLIARAKPRSNLYEYNPDGFNIEKATSTSTDKLVKKVFSSIDHILRFQRLDGQYSSAVLKNRLFNLLDKYTATPEEIKDVMAAKTDTISEMARTLKTVCAVPELMHKDVDNDILNLVEEYLSINWPEKEVFIKDRDAYPVKLLATDEEESKVEQTAALRDPLQTKAIFFDNKKMLYKNRSCDGLVLECKRMITEYFPKNTFSVRISINYKGDCLFKFTEYTSKEDIESVIYSIIGVDGDVK